MSGLCDLDFDLKMVLLVAQFAKDKCIPILNFLFKFVLELRPNNEHTQTDMDIFLASQLSVFTF